MFRKMRPEGRIFFVRTGTGESSAMLFGVTGSANSMVTSCSREKRLLVQLVARKSIGVVADIGALHARGESCSGIVGSEALGGACGVGRGCGTSSGGQLMSGDRTGRSLCGTEGAYGASHLYCWRPVPLRNLLVCPPGDGYVLG